MKRILIVDDDDAIRHGLQKVLNGEGYATALAADADEALAQFGYGDIDLVTLDLNLPSKSGWDVFQRLTEIDPLVPIIVITGRPEQCVVAEAAGVGALLEKPIDVDFLLHTIQTLLMEPNDTRLQRLLGHSPDIRYAPPARHERR